MEEQEIKDELATVFAKYQQYVRAHWNDEIIETESWITKRICDLEADKQRLERQLELANLSDEAKGNERDQLRRELDEAHQVVQIRDKQIDDLRFAVEQEKQFSKQLIGKSTNERIAKLEAERDEYKSLYEKQLAERQA